MEQQDRGGSGSGIGRGVEMRETHHQDQRGRKSHQSNQLQLQQNPPPPPPPPQQQQQPPPPPAQPQKCPRCDSLNTKFCYYNNYSLAQPRYFCKTCRRYWTQGGTLRNVPVGGGCRKGKRLKRSSSPSSPSMDNFSTSSLSTSTTSSVLPLRSSTKGIDNIPSSPMVPIPAGTGVPPPSMYYPSGGFLSSLAGFQSFTQPINIGSEFGGSNLALLQGFNLPFHTQQMHNQQQQQQHHHHHHHHQQQQEQQIYLQESHNLNMGISDELEEKVGHQNRPSTSHQEWSHSQGFPSPNPPEAVDYWSNNNTSTTNTSTTSNLGVSLNPTHWTDHLSGYGGPPQPQPPPPPPSTTSSSSPSFL